MLQAYPQVPTYILPLAIVLASILLGWIAEKIVIRQLINLAEKTSWKGDDILIGSLKGMVFSTSILIGIYTALMNIQIRFTIMTNIHKLFYSVIILMLTIMVARIVVGFVSESSSKVDRIFPASSILRNIIRIVVFVVGGLLILNNLGISITPILTALGVGGLAVALALQPTLSNLFSGIQIIASKQLLPGQYISLSSGEEGYVEDITWRYTSIRALSNYCYIIPNSKISESIIINYYKPSKDTSIVIPVSVAYGSDLEKVEKCCINTGLMVLKNTAGAQKDFVPFVRFGKFGSDGISLSVILRTLEINDRYLVTHEFIKALNNAFSEHKIEIPYPTRTVYLKNTGKE